MNPATGKRKLVYRYSQAWGPLSQKPVTHPCGTCQGCRLEKSRDWAIRCSHEMQMHDDNCFITLTYNDAHLPEGASLVKADFQKFMKRLRKRYGAGIRFFACGEYGPENLRPHYHAILFGHDFADKRQFKVINGNIIYTSEELGKLWSNPDTGSCLGYSSVAAASFETAAYVARYVMKKVTGDRSAEHYRGRLPEYCHMSLKPGIGLSWLERYGATDVFPHDEVVVNGKQHKPPKYYDKVLGRSEPERLKEIKSERERKALERGIDGSSRLRVREKCLSKKLEQLPKKDL